MSDSVLDASALLALLNQEPRAQRWAGHLAGAALSAVNLSEVVAKLTDIGMREADIREALDPLGIAIVPFDAAQAYEAGLLRLQTKPFGLSLGDRACLALAIRMRRAALTTDRAWTKLRVGPEIRFMV